MYITGESVALRLNILFILDRRRTAGVQVGASLHSLLTGARVLVAS